MAVFKAFKPEAMNKIAKSMGYTGNMGEFQNYIEQDPARQARMEQFKNAAVQMAKGGVVKMQTGGAMMGPLGTPEGNMMQQGPAGGPGALPGGKPLDYYLPGAYPPGNTQYAVNPKYTGGKENVYETIPLPTGDPKAAADAERAMMQTQTPAAQTTPTNIGDATVQRMFQPGLPQGGVTQAAFTPTEAGQYVDPRTGMVTGSVAVPTAMASTAQAAPQQEKAANVMEAAAAAPAVDAAMNACCNARALQP